MTIRKKIRFALDDRDFSKILAEIKKDGKRVKILELRQFKYEYILLEHVGDSVGELVSLTKEEWKAIWRMLSLK
jgi:hypothetical protein